MNKSLSILLLLVLLCTACAKNKQRSACGTQVCTALFATVGVHFTDSAGMPIVVQNYTVFNTGSNKQIYPGLPGVDLIKGYYIVASDNDIKDFSNDGDNIEVSATDPATGQTKTVNFKISGGCNCHVAKISGPDVIAFD